jgi:hypothetical protein
VYWGYTDSSIRATIEPPVPEVDLLPDEDQKALIVLDKVIAERLQGTMEPDLTQERRQAHALLDMLLAKKLNAVRSLLEVMVEPLSRSLALAPVEDEEITSETAAALDRARASLARGEGISHQEILREFGLGK